MSKRTTGLTLIQISAWSQIVVSVLVDGVIYKSAHMSNPLWLPHAKLHCAMSFHASIALGIGALLVLWSRRGRLERADLGIAAFLSSAFWISLLTARLWPGTSFTFAKDPAFTTMHPTHVLGLTIVPNAALAVLLVAAAVVGYALASAQLSPAPRPPRATPPRAQPSPR